MRHSRNRFRRSFFLVRARLAVQVIFKFFPEFFYETNRRHRCGIAERTKSSSQHVLRQVLHVVDVFLHSAAGVEADESLFQPVGAFAAWDAPSAALMLVELHGAQGKFHDALRIVNHNHAARTQHGSGFRDGVEIHGYVNLVSFQNRTG